MGWPQLVKTFQMGTVNGRRRGRDLCNCIGHGYSTNTPNVPPPRNKGLIAGLIKGNQWLISPNHKALFLGGGHVRGGWLTSQKLVNTRRVHVLSTFFLLLELQQVEIIGESVPNHRKQLRILTRWWVQIFFIFTPTWGNDPI